MSCSDQKTERFGYDPSARTQFIGKVRTPKITHHGFKGDPEDWEIYFNESTRAIEVCFFGCNGTYFHGTEREDGSTNLHPELDKVFRLLRKGEYVHPEPPRTGGPIVDW